jgi:hypothetical protein
VNLQNHNIAYLLCLLLKKLNPFRELLRFLSLRLQRIGLPDSISLLKNSGNPLVSATFCSRISERGVRISGRVFAIISLEQERYNAITKASCTVTIATQFHPMHVVAGLAGINGILGLLMALMLLLFFSAQQLPVLGGGDLR